MNRGDDISAEYFADGYLPDLTDKKIKFDDKTIARALENIYNGNFDVATELEPDLFLEMAQMLNLATVEGLSEAVNGGAPMPNKSFLNTIKTSNEVFSAFRTHRMQNDIAGAMLDEKGHLKTFSRFAKDVKPYTDHQNRAWLRTEYNTAVARAYNAAQWQQFEAEKDVLPNLEWMPSTSPNPGADHQPFWGTILPVDHPFWNEHRPGDRWNCKCELEATDKEASPTPPEGGANEAPARGLENNTGKDGKLFSDKHPYFPASCGACPFVGGKLKALFANLAGKQKNCYACKRCGEVIEKTQNVTLKSNKPLFRQLQKEAKQSFEVKHRAHTSKNYYTKRLYFGSKDFENVIAHCFTAQEIEAAKQIVKYLPKLKNGKYEPLKMKKNTPAKIQRGVRNYTVYEFDFKGETFALKCEAIKKPKDYYVIEHPYALRKKE